MSKKKDKKKWLIIAIILIAALFLIIYLVKSFEGSAISGGGNQNGGTEGGSQNGGETPGETPPGGLPGDWCSDHDAGLDFGTSSWCEDSDGRFLQDYCSGANILEAYCDDNDECKYYSHTCIGTCSDASCTGERPISWTCCYYSKGYESCFEGECPAGWDQVSIYNSESACEADCGRPEGSYYCCATPVDGDILLSSIDDDINFISNGGFPPPNGGSNGGYCTETGCSPGDIQVAGPWEYGYCYDHCTDPYFCADYCYYLQYFGGGTLVGTETGCYRDEIRIGDCCCFSAGPPT